MKSNIRGRPSNGIRRRCQKCGGFCNCAVQARQTVYSFADTICIKCNIMAMRSRYT